MGHGYLGSEHVLLTIIADADPLLGSLLSRHKIKYQDVRDAIAAALPQNLSPSVVEQAVPAILVRKPWVKRPGTARRPACLVVSAWRC